MLDAAGMVVVDPSHRRLAPARTVGSGELLFGKPDSGILEGPRAFTAPDGSVLRRARMGLVRETPDRRRTRIRCSPVLWPLALPWPGLLAVAALLLPFVPGLEPRTTLEAAREKRSLFAWAGVSLVAMAAPLLLGSPIARIIGLAGCLLGALLTGSIAAGRAKVQGGDLSAVERRLKHRPARQRIVGLVALLLLLPAAAVVFGIGALILRAVHPGEFLSGLLLFFLFAAVLSGVVFGVQAIVRYMKPVG
jgi:hypothetical protein